MKMIATLLLLLNLSDAYGSSFDCQVKLTRYSQDSSGNPKTDVTIVKLTPYSSGGIDGFKGVADNYTFVVEDALDSVSYSIKLPGQSAWNIVGFAPVPNPKSAFTMMFYVNSGNNELICSSTAQ